ncbi:MAG: ElyC/SanA/YdcF family protein [Acidobacteriia bacterium]|nr:ElyC/SanA/YdcF family protein [Terriglobia bacterium]
MFLLKKIVSPLLMPLTILLLMLLVGVATLAFGRRQRLGKILVTAATLLLWLMSFGGVSNGIVRPLEQQYPVLHLPASASDLREALPKVRWIVVLGGGHFPGSRTSFSGVLTSTSMARLIEAIHIYKQIPGSKLLLSGGPVFGSSSDARAMAQVAEGLGIPAADILLEDRSRDTEEEARIIPSMVGADSIVLVTSAIHMPRAMALFRHAGINPIPAPADFLSHPGSLSGRLLPSADSIDHIHNACHEYLGILWAGIRGWK